MIEVGVLGLDTSHPEKFASILGRRDDATVAAVWDDGHVRDDRHVESFCADHDAIRYDDTDAMIDAVDAVMILTVDWNTHRPLAVPFLEAGVPTMVDKPIAGSTDDVEAIEAAAERGCAPLFGGSAVPFHPVVSQRTGDDIDTVLCSGFGDSFYYGAHLIDTVRFLVDANWSRIEPMNSGGQVVTVLFENGSTATLDFDGGEAAGTFAFLSVGDRTDTIEIDNNTDELDRMYEPFLDRFVRVAKGECDDTARLIDSARLLLGVQTAFDGEVVLGDRSMALASTTVDSSTFVSNYEPYY